MKKRQGLAKLMSFHHLSLLILLLGITIAHPYCPAHGGDTRHLEVRRTNVYNAQYWGYDHGHYGSHHQQFEAYFRIDNAKNQKYITLMDTLTVFYDDYWDWRASKIHEFGHPIRLKVYYYHGQIRSTVYMRDAYHYCWSRRISWKWWRYWPRRHFGCRFWWMQHRPYMTRTIAHNVDFKERMWKGKWFIVRVTTRHYFNASIGSQYYGPTATYHHMRHPRYGWWLPWYFYQSYQAAVQRAYAIWGTNHSWHLDHYRLYRDRRRFTPQNHLKYKGNFDGLIFGAYNGWHDKSHYSTQAKLVYFIPGINRTARANNFYKNHFTDGRYNIYKVDQNKFFDDDQPLRANWNMGQRMNGYVFRPKWNNPNINAAMVEVAGYLILKKSKLFSNRKKVMTKQFFNHTKQLNNGRHWWLTSPFYRMIDGKGNKDLFSASLQHILWRHKYRYGFGWYSWHWVRSYIAMARHSNWNSVWAPRNHYSHTPMWQKGWYGWNKKNEKLLSFRIHTVPYYWYPGYKHLYWKNRRYGYHISNTWYRDNMGGNGWIGHFLTEGINSPHITHYIAHDDDDIGQNKFKLFYFQYSSFTHVASNIYQSRWCDSMVDTGSASWFGTSSTCRSGRNQFFKPTYVRRRGCHWMTGCRNHHSAYCGKVDVAKMVVRSNYKTECVRAGEHLKKNKSGRIYCAPKIKNCEILNYNKDDCVKCRPGYEKVVKKGRRWIKRKYAHRKKVSRNFYNWHRKVHARCKPCGQKSIYSIKHQECLPARNDTLREYIVKKDKHQFGPIVMPKYKKAKWVTVNFDVSLYNRGGRNKKTPELFMESVLKYRKNGNFKSKLKKVEDWHDARFRRTSKDATRFWTNLDKTHYDRKSKQKYYRMFFRHRVLADSELWLTMKIHLLNDPKDKVNYTDFYIKRFRYRLDPYSKMKRRARLYRRQWASKISKIARDKVIRTKGPKKVDSDYPFKMEKVAKGLKLPYSVRDMYMGFSGGFTGAQAWFKIDASTLETYDSNTPLLVISTKNIDNTQTIEYALIADLGESKLVIKKNGKIIYSYFATEVDFNLWQFAGLAWKKAVQNLDDVICLYILTSTVNSDVYSPHKGVECKPYPNTGENESVRTRFGADNFGNPIAGVSAMIYGAEISTEPLHLNYYSERNIHINF
jgi:hypothetical protein